MNSRQYLNQIVDVQIDRALGTAHPKYPNMIYPVNYGFVPNTQSGDGEELDAYVLGVTQPVEQYKGRCVAIIHRLKDDDDKLIVVPEGQEPSDADIRSATLFQEQYFESEIWR
jgi:inorganic pyrophosphatase